MFSSKVQAAQSERGEVNQYTLASSLTLKGVGLHSGKETEVKLIPVNEAKRYFVRVDLPGQPLVPAQVEYVQQTTLSTELGKGEAKVRTVEHLLAALTGSGVMGARIEINGPEVPLLDGSALVWVKAIEEVGLTPLPAAATRVITTPVCVQEGDAFVTAIPAPETIFTYGIDFSLAPIGQQWYSWQPKKEDFAQAIAPARTFGFANQINQLREAGLIKGGSLDNALVCDKNGWLNPPLRFANEPARHKLLDLVGDLSLLGTLPQAHFLAYKASHKLHTELAKILLNHL